MFFRIAYIAARFVCRHMLTDTTTENKNRAVTKSCQNTTRESEIRTQEISIFQNVTKEDLSKNIFHGTDNAAFS
jgi:hypothetical protein